MSPDIAAIDFCINMKRNDYECGKYVESYLCTLAVFDFFNFLVLTAFFRWRHLPAACTSFVGTRGSHRNPLPSHPCWLLYQVPCCLWQLWCFSANSEWSDSISEFTNQMLIHLCSDFIRVSPASIPLGEWITIVVFCVVTLYNPAGGYQCFALVTAQKTTIDCSPPYERQIPVTLIFVN